jgi:hypothetical protein
MYAATAEAKFGVGSQGYLNATYRNGLVQRTERMQKFDNRLYK